MSNYAEEPLLKVTVNLFAADVEWLKLHAQHNWSELLRQLLRAKIKEVDEIDAKV